MKHAGPVALETLAPLLAKLRKRTELREKKTGIFYLKSSAFLHFHEDPAGMFADAKLGPEFTRLRVSTKVEQRVLLDEIDRFLGASERR
jgi:hypothetical protein